METQTLDRLYDSLKTLPGREILPMVLKNLHIKHSLFFHFSRRILKCLRLNNLSQHVCSVNEIFQFLPAINKQTSIIFKGKDANHLVFFNAQCRNILYKAA